MIFTVEYGKGRVFHTPMGHSPESMHCVGFITTLVRGCEWAATGKVTLTEVPKDFPTADKVSERP
jgi:type 1 glutamine amidotransferase